MLDTLDHKIIDILQKQGRISNSALAEKISLSPSACLRRMKLLEESGIIKGYVAEIDYNKMGYAATVFVEITLKNQRDEAMNDFEEALQYVPQMVHCHLMGGNFDYLLQLRVKDVADYERLHREHLSKLPYIDRLHSRFALRNVKGTVFV